MEVVRVVMVIVVVDVSIYGIFVMIRVNLTESIYLFLTVEVVAEAVQRLEEVQAHRVRVLLTGDLPVISSTIEQGEHDFLSFDDIRFVLNHDAFRQALSHNSVDSI